MSFDDVEGKKIVRKRIWKMASEDPFARKAALEEAHAHALGLAVALCRRNTCAVLQAADVSCRARRCHLRLESTYGSLLCLCCCC